MRKIDEIYFNPANIRRAVLQKAALVGHLSEKNGVWSCDVKGITYSGTYEGLCDEIKKEELEIKNTLEIWTPCLLEILYSGIPGNPDTIKIDTEDGLTKIIEKLEGFIKISS